MANKINIRFGGRKMCDWSQLPTVLSTYEDIATQYSLIKSGFDLYINVDTVLESVTVGYKKEGLNESAVQTTVDTWDTICDDNDIEKHDTNIQHYEE